MKNKLQGFLQKAQSMIFGAWAIEKSAFDEITQIYSNFSQDPKSFFGGIDMNPEPPRILSINDNVATIKIEGPLVDKHNCSTITFGACSYEAIIQAIGEISEDSSIEKIIFEIDSPGGMVDGVDNCAQAIKAIDIPTEAVVGSLCASAAYWIASQCDTLTASSLTAMFGSIGVIVAYMDDTRRLTDAGFDKIVVVSAGAPNKHLDLMNEDDRLKLKERLTAIEEIFVKRIADGRGIETDRVYSDFGRGGVFLAEKSKRLGMIDNVDFSINNNTESKKDITSMGEQNMTLQEFLAQGEAAQTELKAHTDAAIKVAVNAVNEDNKKHQTEAAEENKKLVAKAGKYLTADYPEAVKSTALEVISGTKSIETLETVVTVLDAQSEVNKSTDAKTETEEAGDTAPTVPVEANKEATDEISDEASLVASAKKLKGYKL